MLLAEEPDIEVVADAADGMEAIAQAARHRPDVILMDIRMPRLDGLQATRRILAADETAKVLILTTFNLDEYVYEALRAGASGFILKDEPAEQLIAAVHIIAAGDALLSPDDHSQRDLVLRAPAATATPTGDRHPDIAGEGCLPAHRRGSVQRRDRA